MRIDAVNREEVLCQVDANCRNYAHGTSPFRREIDFATQSWHFGAASGRGSPLHSLDRSRGRAESGTGNTRMALDSGARAACLPLSGSEALPDLPPDTGRGRAANELRGRSDWSRDTDAGVPAIGPGPIESRTCSAQRRIVAAGDPGGLVDSNMRTVDKRNCLPLRPGGGKQSVSQLEGGEKSGVAGQCAHLIRAHRIG